MSFLARFLPRRGVPAWASFFDRRRYARFVGLVRDELRRRELPAQVGDGSVAVQLTPDGDPMQFGLQNLAQLCNQLPDEEWPVAIQGHMEKMLRLVDEDTVRTFDEARPLLKVRLMAENEARLPGKLVTSPLAPGLVRAVVLDLPEMVTTVSAAEAAAWAPIDELFELGMAHLRAEEPPDRETIDVGGAWIEVFSGESFFVASRVLALADLVDLGGAHGALVAVPARHLLLVHPIRDLSVVPAVNALVQLAERMYRDGPGSLAPDVYWWHAGAFTLIPSTVTRRRVEIAPPDEFVRLLGELPPAPEA